MLLYFQQSSFYFQCLQLAFLPFSVLNPTWVIFRQGIQSSMTSAFTFFRALLTFTTEFFLYCILWCKFVTVYAMSFSSIHSRRTFATQNINFIGHGFGVSGIATMSNTAQVVNRQSLWNRIYKKLIGKTVHRLFLPIYRQFAVSGFFINIARPLPTRIAIIEMFNRYFNVTENTGKKFLGRVKSARIVKGHNISLNQNIVIRLAEMFVQIREPFSIIAQY